MLVKRKHDLFLGGIAVLFVAFLSWQGFTTMRNYELANLHKAGSERLLETIRSLRVAIDQYRYLPFLLSQNRDVKQLLLVPDADNQVRVSRLLEQTNLVAGSAALLILDEQGDIVAYSNWRENTSLPRDRYRDAAFYREALSGEQGPYFVIDKSTMRPAYYLSAPIYQSQKLIGVAVLRLNIATLREQLSNESLFYVADANDSLLLTSPSFDQEHIWPLAPGHVELLLDGREITLGKHKGEYWLVQAVKLDDLQWQVGVLSPIQSANLRSAYVALSIAGVCMVLALLFLYLREAQLKRRSQRETVNAQRESEQRQRRIINTAQVGLITVDSAGKILSINSMVMQQFGVSQSLIERSPLTILFADIDQFSPLKRMLDVLKRREFSPITGYEVVGQRSDGSRFPMMFSIRMMSTAPETTYLVTIIDITRRKRLEHALQEANESLEQKVSERTLALKNAQAELLQAEKMAAMGRMSTAIVHELNQPLTAMRNYLAMLRQIREHPDMFNDNLQRLNQLVDRMASLTGQLKTFAYKKVEVTGAVDLQSVIPSVLTMFNAQMKANEIRSVIQMPETSIRVKGDQVRLEQVLVNLIGNACDALEEAAQDHPSVLTVTVSTELKWAHILISDNGDGVSEEALAHLFEPFYTTKSMGSGLGLGLSIVDNILRDLGGKISARNNSEGGLGVLVTLPLAD
ncbi:sensor histidine kinase [Neptunomonas phycophila]|nr:sensor histidine kinase [Neptunomonas phycophila]